MTQGKKDDPTVPEETRRGRARWERSAGESFAKRPPWKTDFTTVSGAPVTPLFEWYTVDGSFMGSEQPSPRASGSLFTGHLPFRNFADGVSYTWRARAFDSRKWRRSTVAGVASPTRFTRDDQSVSRTR